MSKVTVLERGWGGHFCAAAYCLFRRNTLVQDDKRSIVVSTVGNLRYPESMGMGDGPQEMGARRYYETMAFEGAVIGGYVEADVSRKLPFPVKWAITADSPSDLPPGVDNDANDMHEGAVQYFAALLEGQR